MSTITYRDGVMVSDSRAYSGHNSPIGSKCKIARLSHGWLAGVSTEQPGATEALLGALAEEWDKFPPTLKVPDHLAGSYEILVVSPHGKGFFANSSLLFSGPLDAPYFAVGSGATFAMGAFEMGATALTACRISARIDPWTDAPFHLMTHEGRHDVLNGDGSRQA